MGYRFTIFAKKPELNVTLLELHVPYLLSKPLRVIRLI